MSLRVRQALPSTRIVSAASGSLLRMQRSWSSAVPRAMRSELTRLRSKANSTTTRPVRGLAAAGRSHPLDGRCGVQCRTTFADWIAVAGEATAVPRSTPTESAPPTCRSRRGCRPTGPHWRRSRWRASADAGPMLVTVRRAVWWSCPQEMRTRTAQAENLLPSRGLDRRVATGGGGGSGGAVWRCARR